MRLWSAKVENKEEEVADVMVASGGGDSDNGLCL